MKTSITKMFTFEAAHRLPNYVGACANLHGHSYKLAVTVTIDKPLNKDRNATGMIMDFKVLKDIVNRKVVGPLDHSLLNDFYYNPTAEIMVEDFAANIQAGLNDFDENVYVSNIKLWETEDSYAEWSID